MPPPLTLSVVNRPCMEPDCLDQISALMMDPGQATEVLGNSVSSSVKEDNQSTCTEGGGRQSEFTSAKGLGTQLCEPALSSLHYLVQGSAQVSAPADPTLQISLVASGLRPACWHHSGHLCSVTRHQCHESTGTPQIFVTSRTSSLRTTPATRF